MIGLIDINTDTLTSLVKSAGKANEAINEAAAKLKSITQHNNWNCKERDRINEHTNENIAHIEKLQNNSYEFLNNIESSVSDFISEEKDISNMFEALEEIISTVGSISTISSIVNNHSSFLNTMKKIRETGGPSGLFKSVNNSAINLWNLSSSVI